MQDTIATIRYHLQSAIKITQSIVQILTFLDTVLESLMIVQSLREGGKNGH